MSLFTRPPPSWCVSSLGVLIDAGGGSGSYAGILNQPTIGWVVIAALLVYDFLLNTNVLFFGVIG